MVQIGSSSCLVRFINAANTQLICTLSAGQGSLLQVQVSCAGQLSNTAFFSYDPPTLNSVSPLNGPTAGGITLILNGASLGTAGTTTVGGTACTETFHNHTQIWCTLPAGEGVNRDVQSVVSSAATNV